MAKDHERRGLRARIPIFRIFYNITYSIIYLICLVFLAITPITMLYSAIKNTAFQYVLFIGGTYILTFIIAVVLYSSRLYTNRAVMAAVGKAYIPIEKGEVGNMVRKMIAKQNEANAVVAWEARPRDLFAEGYPVDAAGEDDDDYPEPAESVHSRGRLYKSVGTRISLDPQRPPWGRVRHAGWSSPSHEGANRIPDLQFANVVSEMPHLLEAHAVSLAPSAAALAINNEPVRDEAVLDILRRPANMGVRDYLAYLASLGLVQSPLVGQSFLTRYERASFSGIPATEAEFYKLMAAFSNLLADMSNVEPATLQQIRTLALNAQIDAEQQSQLADSETADTPDGGFLEPPRPSSMHSFASTTSSRSLISPVTAREAPSRNLTPYLQQQPLQPNNALDSVDSFASVIHRTPRQADDVFAVDDPPRLEPPPASNRAVLLSPSMESLPSDAGSVLHYSPNG